MFKIWFSDTFAITNQQSVPTICGTNTNAHGKTLTYVTLRRVFSLVLFSVYFDASENCNILSFMLGNNANGISTVATRSWSIKATQISCYSDLLAPNGCTQYYYGSGATNYVRTFNFDGSPSRHLADQKQTICVRWKKAKSPIRF